MSPKEQEIFYFKKHLSVLEKAKHEDLTNEFIVRGIIAKFFIQFELGWKLLKELLKYEGKAVAATGSPREIIKAAYGCYDFLNEETWLSMLKSRNDLTHIYDEEQAGKLVNIIIDEYIPEFQRLLQQIEEIYGKVLEQL